jgi:hypothetical protein
VNSTAVGPSANPSASRRGKTSPPRQVLTVTAAPERIRATAGIGSASGSPRAAVTNPRRRRSAPLRARFSTVARHGAQSRGRPTGPPRPSVWCRRHRHARLSDPASRIRPTFERRDQAQPLKTARSGSLRRRRRFRLRRSGQSRCRTDASVACGSPEPPPASSAHAAEGRFFHAAKGRAETTGGVRQTRVKNTAVARRILNRATIRH